MKRWHVVLVAMVVAAAGGVGLNQLLIRLAGGPIPEGLPTVLWWAAIVMMGWLVGDAAAHLLSRMR